MITERKEDLAAFEMKSFIEKMIAKYAKAFLGDRFVEVENGELYDERGRQPGSVGEEMGSIDLGNIGR